MCRCYLTHLPARQPRAVRFLAYGTAAVLQTLHSDPNKLANLSCLLTWVDSSCTTATCLPWLFPPQSLQTFHKEGLTFFPPLQAFPTSCQSVVLGKNIRFPQPGFTNTNTKCKTTCTFALLSCHMGWLSHKQHSGLLQSLMVCGARPLAAAKQTKKLKVTLGKRRKERFS